MFIGPKVTTIGDGVFTNTALTSVKIPNNVKTLGVRIFYACSKLLSAQIGTGLSEIPNYAFDACSQLMSLTIREGITHIGEYAFKGCIKLAMIMMGSGMANIGYYAFSNLEELYDVYCEVVNPPSLDGSNPFYNSHMEYTVLHVPTSSVATYQSTSPWKYFKEVVALDGQPQPEPPSLMLWGW